jgi:uncharacterized membrane protein
MYKKLFLWVIWRLWVSFCLFFLSAAACGLFVFGREYLHGLIEVLADIVIWFWGLHWTILTVVFIVLGVYFLYLQEQKNIKEK